MPIVLANGLGRCKLRLKVEDYFIRKAVAKKENHIATADFMHKKIFKNLPIYHLTRFYHCGIMENALL